MASRPAASSSTTRRGETSRPLACALRRPSGLAHRSLRLSTDPANAWPGQREADRDLSDGAIVGVPRQQRCLGERAAVSPDPERGGRATLEPGESANGGRVRFVHQANASAGRLSLGAGHRGRPHLRQRAQHRGGPCPRTSPCPPHDQADHSYLCLVTINLDRHSHRTHALIATGEAAGAAVLLGVSVLAIRRRRRPVTPS
jgi:hypothetical protein